MLGKQSRQLWMFIYLINNLSILQTNYALSTISLENLLKTLSKFETLSLII